MRQNKLIAVIVLLIVVGLVVWYGKKPNEETVKTSSLPQAEGVSTNFNTILPKDWKFTAQAQKDLASYLQDTAPIDAIVQHPTEPHIYYFSTQKRDDSCKQNFLSVYRYDSTNYTFDRIYKNTYSESPPIDGTAGFLLQGYDASGLVFWRVYCEHLDKPSSLCALDNNSLLILSQETKTFQDYTNELGRRTIQSNLEQTYGRCTQ